MEPMQHCRTPPEYCPGKRLPPIGAAALALLVLLTVGAGWLLGRRRARNGER